MTSSRLLMRAIHSLWISRALYRLHHRNWRRFSDFLHTQMPHIFPFSLRPYCHLPCSAMWNMGRRYLSFGFQFMEISKIRNIFEATVTKKPVLNNNNKMLASMWMNIKHSQENNKKNIRSWGRFYTKGRGYMQLKYQICVYNIQTFLSDFTLLLIWCVLMPITRYMYPCTLHAW